MEGTVLLRGVLALRACWLAWARGPAPPSADPRTPEPGSPGLLQRPFLQGYRDHLACTFRSCLFCLRCGQRPRDNCLGFSLLRDGTCRGSTTTLSATVTNALAPLGLEAAPSLGSTHHNGLLQNLVVDAGTLRQCLARMPWHMVVHH